MAKVNFSINPKIIVAKAGNKGLGVFAKGNIRKGEVLEISPFLVTPKEEHNKLARTIISRYWYKVYGKSCGIGFGYTSLYNHAKNPSASWTLNRKLGYIRVVALKTILEGEEISIHYGYSNKDLKEMIDRT